MKRSNGFPDFIRKENITASFLDFQWAVWTVRDSRETLFTKAPSKCSWHPLVCGQVASQHWSLLTRLLFPLYFHSTHCPLKNSTTSGFGETPRCVENISVHVWDERMTPNKPSVVGRLWSTTVSWSFLPWSLPTHENSPIGQLRN